MKKLKLFLGLLGIVGAFLIVSCGHKSGNSPVDQYVEVIDNATEKAKQLSSLEDLSNLQEIILPSEAVEIISNNADYVLTDKDKEKIKKSFDKLLRAAYDKTAEYQGVPGDLRKTQVDILLQGANNQIDASRTLGDLNGIN